MIATYTLAHYLASFEFFYWLVMVQTGGATEICLDPSNPRLKNFTLEDVKRRFHTIIEPGPALAGLPYHIGNTPTEIVATPSKLQSWYEAGGRFKRLETVKPPVKCDYTVTIRDNNNNAMMRDSNRPVWEQFAKEIGAIVIDDYYCQPISLHDRVALYAGAKMNFGVCNGPIAALTLTPYPVTMFINGQSARNSQTRFGLKPGQKYPWMLPNQHLAWRYDDTVKTLMKAFEEINQTVD